jgi:hypothetical protein
MAVNHRVFPGVGPDAVFDVLRDGHSYGHWVVGTRKIRAVDAGWPAAGARLHYTVGYAPLRKDGETRSLAYEPGRRLELEIRAWPTGTVRVEFRTERVAEGTLVTMVEHPARGPATRLHNRVLDGVIKVRNVETLRRLERLALNSATPDV